MFDQLKRFLGSLDGGGTRPPRLSDPRVAFAALLVHVAEADGAFTTAERERLSGLLQREFGIGEREAGRLLEEGRRADAEAIDLYGFTSILMNGMDAEGRHAFVELVWSLIYVDGDVHELEDNLAWRICELLGISTEDRMAAKRAAARRAGAAAAALP